ncbi:hypothetical protein H4S01_002953 [Coemansia sp. RSA 2610]|nr:hypothetical protein H4S01_002953 [Coemansia sp. RSA 2610]
MPRLCSAAAAGLWLAAAARGYPARQPADDLSGVKAGVFVKDGNQTACGLALLDSRAAMLSADCLDFNGRAVDMDTDYRVYIDSAYDGTPAQHAVDAVTVHPGYNPDTRANNIAVLEFNGGGALDWHNYNALVPAEWDSLLYVQRYLADVSTAAWGAPNSLVQTNRTDPACADLSPLYAANANSYVCTDAVIGPPSPADSSCKVPYSLVYARAKGAYYQAGIASYAVIAGGTSLCSYASARSYFVLLADYLPFAQSVLNRTVHYLALDDTEQPQSAANFTVNNVDDDDDSHAVLSGDFYALQGIAVPSASDSDSGLDSADGGSAHDGLSRSATIGVAVGCAVGGVLLAAAAFVSVRWWCGHKRRTRDPMLETNARAFLADDLGGAAVPLDCASPPTYGESQSHHHAAVHSSEPADSDAKHEPK